jgi:phosphoribosylformylglycinamidine (FGAM) synthase-like amidotransferase family enzyme
LSFKKVLNVIFFTNRGPTIQIAVAKESGNVKFNKSTVLHKLKIYFKNRQPATGQRGARLWHNNASSQKAAIVLEFLKQENVLELLPHRSCPL